MKGLIVALTEKNGFLERLERDHGAFSRFVRRLPAGDWTMLTNSRMLSKLAALPVEEADVCAEPNQLCPAALLAAHRFLSGPLRDRRLVIVDASFPLLTLPKIPSGDVVGVEKARFHPNHGLRNLGGGVVDYLVPPKQWHNKVHGRDMLPEVYEINGAVTAAVPARLPEFEQSLRSGRVRTVITSEVEGFSTRTELGYRCLHEILERGLQEKWTSGRVEIIELEKERMPA
jgi:hypothetical protein